MRYLLIGASLFAITACATATETNVPGPDFSVEDTAELATDMSVPAVMAVVETTPVPSGEDAADDPAFYYDATNPGASYVLGTDKQGGLALYGLDGVQRQFEPTGRLNNVDIRQNGPMVAGAKSIAVASNRSDDTIAVFAVEPEMFRWINSFSAHRAQPYGICLGAFDTSYYIAVTHKSGEVDIHLYDGAGEAEAALLDTLQFDSQLEGCVFDEAHNALYVGEENAGITRMDLIDGKGGLIESFNPRRVDIVDGANGLTADIEGLTIYARPDGSGYLVASSQGNNTFAVYDRQSNEFLGQFRIADNDALGIDGAEETDGIDATAAALPGFPEGMLIVQDGFNYAPDGSKENQNFKYVDWRDIAATLHLD